MQITKNAVVSFHYTLNDPDGKLLDTSAGREPFAYLHGAGNIVPGLEEELEGKAAGDKVQVAVPPAKGYGEFNAQLVHQVPKDRFGDQPVEEGMQFQAGEQGELGVFTVMEVKEDLVMLNGNHPLAGVTLHFSVEITDVREASEEEVAHGHVH